MNASLPHDRRGRPLTRSALALSVCAALGAAAASAQTTVGPGNLTGYTNVTTGTAGPTGTGTPNSPQPGGPGQSPSALTVTFQPQTYIVGGGSAPTVSIGLIGGAGGLGNDAVGHNEAQSSPADYGGNGGPGGTPGLLTWTVSNYINVTSSTTAPFAVQLTSQGGAGGFAGGFQRDYGFAGTPGAGGSGGNLTLSLGGSIYSSNGWSGATPGTTALVVSSLGANGGVNPNTIADNSASAELYTGDVHANPGGAGGNGGAIQVTSQIANVHSATAGMVLVSQGGNGSDGSSAAAPGGHGYGGAGGAGGSGGTVNLTIGDASQPNFSIVAVGAATAATGLSIPVTEPDQNGNQIYAQASYPAAAIQLQSLGGNGGAGGTSSGSSATGGVGGASGSGSGVTLSYSATGLSTTGYAAPGVVAQSVGGSGGNGADAGGAFKRKGGSGGLGGDGGSVNLNFFDWNGATQNSVLQTAGDDSPAIVAQSIGGGGGVGGSVSVAAPIGAVAIGGQGESGGVGGTVTITNGGGNDPNGKADSGIVVSTAGTRASAIVAQSIGGGGGSGGSAQSTAIGPFAYAVGGNAGSGGNAGAPGTTQVSVTNAGIVATGGDHSRGIEAQAIGGGGGSGGSASTLTASGELNVNVSVGGQAGAGGDAGDVNVQNPGQIVTQGADAFGLVAQSIGGGGGNGGMSKADALQLASSSEFPSFTVSVDLGGQGGSAGNGGNVTVGNGFSIMTAGAGAHGVIAQSIGGGGGNGGDSSTLVGQVQGSTFTYSVSAGGSGGSGGSTGQVTVDNNGLIWTMGQDSHAVLAQSISGGGGSGGLGASDTSAFSSDKTSNFTIAIGGEGANGADANQVTVNNYSGVLTTGDGSGALFAQSIGGGGGNGGGGIGYGTGGTVGVDLAIGGKGGSGGDGGDVFVNNYATGAIVTVGAGAPGIFAQSVGGSGGTGGRGAVSGSVSPVTLILDYLKTGDLAVNYTQSYGDSDTFVQGWKNTASALFGQGVQGLLGMASDYVKTNIGGLPPTQGSGGGSFTVNLNVGAVQTGAGGSGGQGGGVTILNEGQILTQGPASSGIQAQSVGGGGGSAGSVLVGTSGSFVPENVVANFVIGGAGGAAGDGGLVSITNYNQVTTQGDQSHGLVAQSVGGGGGLAGYTGSPAAGRSTYGFTLGGDGGANGNGGGYGSDDGVPGVSVENFAATVGTAVVKTSGDDAVGIIAQNIGGGGGLMSWMYAVADGNGGVVSTSSQANLSTPVVLTLSAHTAPSAAGCDDSQYLVAACGNAGEAYVTSDTIATSGRNSHGVVAQSIGGGGGALFGGTLTGNNFFANSATSMGNGGQVQVNIRGPLTTTGDGAIGVIAQSIGGGGLLGGDVASASAFAARPSAFQAAATPSFFQGDGGEVDVTVVQGGSIRTSGAFAHGIYAQSVGGGGGLIVTQDHGWIDGSGGGIGSAGIIDIEVDGIVTTTGKGAIGVYANSDGSTNSPNPVGITVTGAVGSEQFDAIVINSSATGNTVTNSGTISGAVGQAAVTVANGSNAAVNVTNSAGGNLYGNVVLGGGTLTNAGNWYPDGANVANVQSTGYIGVALGRTVPSSNGQMPTVFLSGNLQHSGVLQTTVDFATGQASKLWVTGTANLTGSQFSLIPTSTGSQPVTILQSTGTLTLGQNTVYDGGQLGQFSYQLSTPNPNELQVTQQSKMAAVAGKAGLSRTEQSVAAHLDANFAAGAPGLGDAFLALGRIDTLPQFRSALVSLANEAVNAVGTARLAASQAFATRMNSCPDFVGSSTFQIERECAWGRVVGDWTSRDTTSDSIGYTVDSRHLQLGGQKQLAPGWFLGGSIAYDWSDFAADAVPTNVDGKGLTVGAVIKRQDGPWLVSAGVDAGYGWYDSTRTVTLGSPPVAATASFNGQHAGVHARIAYQLPQQDWYLRPYLDLHAIYQRTDAFTETGARALDLNVSSSSATRFVASPMLELGGRLDLDGGTVLKPVFGIGGSFFDKNEWSTQVRFDGSPSAPFEVNSSLPSTLLNVDVGMTLMNADHLHLRLDYSGQFGNDYRSNGGSLKLSYLF
jgi:hypothetical protein